MMVSTSALFAHSTLAFTAPKTLICDDSHSRKRWYGAHTSLSNSGEKHTAKDGCGGCGSCEEDAFATESTFAHLISSKHSFTRRHLSRRNCRSLLSAISKKYYI
uniref:Putative secreted protein n=1 Tax=Ixodes ricinus TaxID=34613 RepID=A0A6B0UAR7_IXORI